MPDAFFQSSKTRKRKRDDTQKSHSNANANSNSHPNAARGANATIANPTRSRGGAGVRGRGRGVGRGRGRGGTTRGGGGGRGGRANVRGGGRGKDQDEELNEGGGGGSESGDDWEGIQEMDLRPDEIDPNESGDEEEEETPAEKRLRLAQVYLDSVKQSLAEGEYDAAEIDKDLISSRLKQDVLEHSGKVHLFIADSLSLSLSSSSFTTTPIIRLRNHRYSITSAQATESGKYLFTAGKEGNITKWDLLSGKKVKVLYKQRPSSSSFTENNKQNGNSTFGGKAKGGAKGKGKAKTNTSTVPSTDESKGHTDEVLALAISSDGKWLVSGGKDKRVVVWDVESGDWVKTFKGPMNHKDIISALTFRKQTHQLFTASFDRTLKIYDLSPTVMGYVETLFGHQDHILQLDSLRGDNCVSVGGRDKTVRYWKVVEETQLVFRGGGRSRVREILEGSLGADADEEVDEDGMGMGMDVDGERRDGKGDKKEKGKGKGKERERNYLEGSIECVVMIDESTFISGGDSGSICLWATQKKKPIFTYPLAHGLHTTYAPESEGGVVQTPRWITSLGGLRYSDLFVSGSWEGELKLWKIDSKLKSFSFLHSFSIPGVINSIQIISVEKNFKPTWANTSLYSPSTSTSILPFSSTTSPDFNSNTTNISINAMKNEKKEGLENFPLLIIVGTGQEHKFGRWLSVKEGGAVNATYVIGLGVTLGTISDSRVVQEVEGEGQEEEEEEDRTLN